MIQTVGLTKKYDDFVALDSLDLKLERGDLFGFIGPNGAGKTTTIRILSTLLAPTWGEAYVCGYSVHTHPREIRRAIGYMPDVFGVYDDMRVGEYLEFFAAAYRIAGPERRRVAEHSLELVDLGSKRDELVTSLSRGMTQRLGLARVLLHDPEVLLLDEPASGLDPRARIEMRNLLKQLQGMGKTILVSSHILPELADICNRVGIIEYGRLLACGGVGPRGRGRGVSRRRDSGHAHGRWRWPGRDRRPPGRRRPCSDRAAARGGQSRDGVSGADAGLARRAGRRVDFESPHRGRPRHFRPRRPHDGVRPIMAAWSRRRPPAGDRSGRRPGGGTARRPRCVG